jgi:malate dehydrogenase (oxaloacetate-decarboxylating)(NADP+)
MTHFGHARDVIGRRRGVDRISALSCLVLPTGKLFVADTYVNVDPTAEQLCEMTRLAADAVRRFGIEPQVALVSHSNFGASGAPGARKMRAALALLRAHAPELAVDGEMHGDAALIEAVRARIVMDSPLKGAANLLIMPSLDAANITFTTLRAAADGLEIGPMLLGMAKPIHVLTNTVTARGITNVTALAVAECGTPG